MSKKAYFFIKYLSFALIFYVLFYANIGGLSCFSFGLYFCLVWCGQSALLLSPLYVLSAYLHNFCLIDLLCALILVSVFLSFYFLHFKFKKPLNLVLIGFYALLTQIPFLYLNTGDANQFFNAGLSVFAGMIFMFCSIHFLQGLLLMGFRRRFHVDEIICACVLLTVFASGLYLMPYGFYISTIVSTFTILFALWCLGSSKAIVVAVLLGLGTALATQNISFIVRYSIIGITAAAMLSNKRIYAVLCTILVDVVIELYLLPVHSIGSIICVIIGALLFLIMPKQVIKSLSHTTQNSNKVSALTEVFERSRSDLQIKLRNMSNLFVEMQQCFLKLVKNNYSTTDMLSSVENYVKSTICSKCPNKNDCCTLNYQETNYHLTMMSKMAYKRGKVNLVDAAPNFAKQCIRLPVIVNAINNSVNDYKQTAFTEQNNNQSKLMLAEQFFGVSEIFNTLSNTINNKYCFDVEKENEIVENLSRMHILCTNCLLYNSGENVCIVLTVRERDLLLNKIVKCIAGLLNTKLEVFDVSPSEVKNYLNLTLRNKNIYDFAYGCAGVTKLGSEKSGDTHSVLKLNDGKVVFSVCDGMGSGDVANDISKLSLSLIENFYKVGFETENVLKIVNSLLNQRGEEKFSAIDLGVLDLVRGEVSVFKLGAPCSFLKHKSSTEVISASSLPLGIVKEIKPYVETFLLADGDIVVFASDGVVDAINDVNRLKVFINNLNSTNPQTLANEIMNYAMHVCDNQINDDMTVFVGRIVKNE